MRVTAVDRDVSGIADLRDRVEIVAADLEDGSPWPLAGRRFDAVVATNYLYRPLLPTLVATVAEGGVLIYETFAVGHERFARPRNPEHLLRAGELLDAVAGTLRVIAYESGEDEGEAGPRVIQRICALRAR